MNTMVTRRNAGKDRPAGTPTATKTSKDNIDNQESENSDTRTLDLNSLSSEQKLDFLCKRVEELTFLQRKSNL